MFVRSRSRHGFTIIELMVVILIIAVLVSLVSSAAIKAMNKLPEVQASTDIASLSVSMQAFMMDFQLSEPPPSILYLSESPPFYDPLHPETGAWLQKAFGKNFGFGQAWIDWNGDLLPSGPITLVGSQCLVFYLGGIPKNTGTSIAMTGFAANNMNPALPVGAAGGSKRRGPYFDFQASRLVYWPANPTLFPMYLDSWASKRLTGPLPARPYVYFSSSGNYNGYSTRIPGSWTPGTPSVDGALGGTDAAGNVLGAAPFYTPSLSGAGVTPQYLNPNGFQIVSAGRDGLYSLYGWMPTTGGVPSNPPFPQPWAWPVLPVPNWLPNNTNTSLQAAVNDDQANFTTGTLINSQQ